LTFRLLAWAPVVVTSEQTIAAAPRDATERGAPAPDRLAPARRRRRLLRWTGAALVVIGVAVAIVLATGLRPGYDAFGWLVWGHQVLHWNLNTDGAPSWKPLPFLFTLPFALAGQAQMGLWTVTAVAGALAGGVFAARIAFRLTGPAPGRAHAPVVGALVAGVGVLGIGGYAHQVLIANSDPLIVTLCLAAIDAHLSKRPCLAFGLLVLAALGRPEAWPFAVLYALWLWRTVPRARPAVVGGIALIPAFWFTIPALTSHSWFISGDLALNAATVIHGNKISGVVQRLRGLYELPMQITVLAAFALAALRRDRAMLGLAAAAILWTAVEIAFALHGWSAVQRYLFEPAAVCVVLAGAVVGRALAWIGPRPRLLGWVAPAAAAALVVALIPAARSREAVIRTEVARSRVDGRQIDRLQSVVAADGGAHRIRSCGQPVTLVGNQSSVAWALKMNVGNVGYRPGVAIRSGEPIVLFKPHLGGWQVRPYNVAGTDAASCAALKIDSAFN
jgi:hypothetical protein